MKKTLFSRLLKTYVLITLLSIVVASLFFYIFFKNHYFSVKEEQLTSQGEKMAQILSPYIDDLQLNRINEITNDFNHVNPSHMWVVNKERKLISGFEDTTKKDHLYPKTDQLESALNGEIDADYGLVQYIDDPVLSIAIPIHKNNEVIGVLFICSPLSEMTTSILQALKMVMIAGLIALLIVAFVSYFISQSITKPIKDITESTKEIIKGNFTYPARVNSSDEIGQLAETFNNMRLALDKSLKDLEYEKNKMAAMEKMQREFVANASHELRTPLTSVRGYIEALLDGVVNSKEQENKYLRIMLKETLRLHRLVHSLLDLSRIESGQIKINMKKLNLAEVIDRIVMKFESLADDGSLHIKVEMDEDLPPVNGDEDLIEQVLINYMTNAIRFTPEGGEITLKAYQNEKEVTVSIIDTGIGITPEELANIWKRFYKIDQARSLSKEGSGLGLSIVKEIMNRLGGKAWAESTPNQGSSFSFSLKAM